MLSARTKFQWTVTLQAPNGQVVEAPFSSYWSPDKEGIKEAVGISAAIQESMKYPPVTTPDGPRRHPFAVIAVAYNEAVTPDEADAMLNQAVDTA